MANLKLWSQSGISIGDVAFIPTFGLSYADPTGIPTLNYKCGFLVKATSDFTNAQKWDVTTTKQLAKRDNLTLDVDTAGSGLYTAGGFNLVRFSVSTAKILTISGRLFAVKPGITYDLLYFGSSITHYAYLIANDNLIQSEVITSTAGTALTISAGIDTLVGKWKATSKEYLICNNTLVELPNVVNTTVTKISRAGTFVKSSGGYFHTSPDGISWTQTIASGSPWFIHETKNGTWITETGRYNSTLTQRLGDNTIPSGTAHLLRWQNGITEDVANGILWAAPYDYTLASGNGIHKIYRSDNDGITWTEQIDVSSIFGVGVRHCENVLYNKYTDRLHIVVGESGTWGEPPDNGDYGIGPITAVSKSGKKTSSLSSDYEKATISPHDYYSCGGYYRGAVLANGTVIHGSDTGLAAAGGDLYASFDAKKVDGVYDLLLGKKMGGKWAKGCTQSYSTKEGIGIWCKNTSGGDDRQDFAMLAFHNGQPIHLFDSSIYISEHAIEGTSDYQSNKFIMSPAVATSPAQLYSFDLDVPLDSTRTSTILYNTTVTAPTPNPTRTGFRFTGWYYDTLGTLPWSSSDTFTANDTLYAGWVPGSAYSITASSDLHYSIYPQDNVAVDSGETVTFTITAEPGYNYTLIVDGVDVGKSSTYTFTNVTANHTIHVASVMMQVTTNIISLFDLM